MWNNKPSFRYFIFMVYFVLRIASSLLTDSIPYFCFSLNPNYTSKICNVKQHGLLSQFSSATHFVLSLSTCLLASSLTLIFRLIKVVWSMEVTLNNKLNSRYSLFEKHFSKNHLMFVHWIDRLQVFLPSSKLYEA